MGIVNRISKGGSGSFGGEPKDPNNVTQAPRSAGGRNNRGNSESVDENSKTGNEGAQHNNSYDNSGASQTNSHSQQSSQNEEPEQAESQEQEQEQEAQQNQMDKQAAAEQQAGKEQAQQQEEQEDEGGDEGDGKEGKSKGLFGGWKDKRRLNAIKRRTKIDQTKDKALGPYRKNMIPESNVKVVKGRESGNLIQPVTWKSDNLMEKFKEKQDLGKKINELTPQQADKAEKLEGEYKKKDAEVKQAGKNLWKELAKADIKRAMEGPAGCLKDIKAGCLGGNVAALFIVGGIITAILSICGVF